MSRFLRLRTDDDVAADRDSRILAREVLRCVRDAGRAGAKGAGVSRLRLPYWFVRAFLGRLGHPLVSSDTARIAIRLDGTEVEVLVRKDASDLDVVREVLLERCYDFPYERFCPRVATIVDLGANVGVAAAFFAARFPAADILCVEPVEESVEVLRLNAGRARTPWRVEQAVAASHVGVCDLYVSGWWATATTIPEIAERRTRLEHRAEHLLALPPRQAQAMTIDELMRRHSIRDVDLLKIDVEGAERDLLQGPGAWLEATQAIVLDIHEKYVDAGSVRSSLRARGFSRVASRGRCELFVRTAYAGTMTPQSEMALPEATAPARSTEARR
jgi:FkbM family methyltransferase